MNERQHRDELFREKQPAEEGLIAKYEKDRYGGQEHEAPYDKGIGSQLTPKQLEAQSAHLYQELPDNQITEGSPSERSLHSLALSTLQDKAGNLGLNTEELGKSVQDLSIRLSGLSNPSSESTAW